MRTCMLLLPFRVLAIALVLSPAAVASAQVIEEYQYVADQVYPVRTGLGITTQIELSPHEEILDYSTGFSAGWDLSRRGNVFYLKPRNVDVDTNLMVRTAAHSYIFELKVVATDWRRLEQAKAAGVQYRIRFAYPGDTAFRPDSGAIDAPEPPTELSTQLQPDRHYHFNYEYARRRQDPGWLVPATVYDDQRFTYIRMGDRNRFPSGNFPAVFARDSERGDEFVVNSTVEGDTIVVHGTYPYLVMRHGEAVVGLRRSPQP